MWKIAFRWNGTGPNGFHLALLCTNLGAVENLCEQPTLVLKLVVHMTQTLRVRTNSQADRTQLCRWSTDANVRTITDKAPLTPQSGSHSSARGKLCYSRSRQLQVKSTQCKVSCLRSRTNITLPSQQLNYLSLFSFFFGSLARCLSHWLWKKAFTLQRNQQPMTLDWLVAGVTNTNPQPRDKLSANNIAHGEILEAASIVTGSYLGQSSSTSLYEPQS